MQKCKSSNESGKIKENNFDFGFSHLMFWFVGSVQYADDMFEGGPQLLFALFFFPFTLLLRPFHTTLPQWRVAMQSIFQIIS